MNKKVVVQNIKDTIFWKQFTTLPETVRHLQGCSEYQRYNFLKAIHNLASSITSSKDVVQNIKDTIFWKQFTTLSGRCPFSQTLFRISKIQFFESNSQPISRWYHSRFCCSEYQRYNFLKAIHNLCLNFNLSLQVVQNIKDTIFWKQFTTTCPTTMKMQKLFRISKIQFFESNSQRRERTKKAGINLHRLLKILF